MYKLRAKEKNCYCHCLCCFTVGSFLYMGYFRHGFLTYIVYGLLLLVYRDLSDTSIHISWPTGVEGAITNLSHPIHYYRDKDRGVDPRGVASFLWMPKL